MIGRHRRRDTLLIQRIHGLRTARFGAALIVVALYSVFFAAPTAAQDSSDAPVDRSLTLRIVDQNTFVAADGSLDLVVEVSGLEATESDGDEPTGLIVSTVIYGRLLNESEVDGPPGTPLARHSPVALDSLEPAGDNRWRISVPIRSSDRFDGQERALLREPGVYPITLELRDLEGPLVSVRTHLVRLAVETSETVHETPISLSLVLAISTAEGLSVDNVVALLTKHPTMPLTVLLGPGVVNQLQGEPEQTAALVAALAGRPVLAAPTIDLDPSALAEIDQSALFLDAARSDRALLEALGFKPAQGIGLLAAPLTAQGIGTVAKLGWRTVLDIDDQQTTSVRVTGSNQPFTVLRPDVELTALLDRSPLTSRDDGSFRANRVLSRLVLRGVSNEGAVVLGGPALGVDAKDALAEVLEALTQPGGPRPVPLDAVQGGLPQRPAERPAQDLRDIADQVAQLRSLLATFAGFAAYDTAPTSPTASLSTSLTPAEPSPSVSSSAEPGVEQRLSAALDRQRNPSDRARALALLQNQLADELSTIHLPDPQPVTLAARNAALPVVVDNDSSESRTVLLRLRSNGLVSPDDGRTLQIGPGSSSIDVQVEARSLGVSPLEVSVWTPDGTVQLATAQFEVRSTAIPGLGIAFSLVACAVLAGWWWIDRSRRVTDPQNTD